MTTAWRRTCAISRTNARLNADYAIMTMSTRYQGALRRHRRLAPMAPNCILRMAEWYCRDGRFQQISPEDAGQTERELLSFRQSSIVEPADPLARGPGGRSA